MLNENTREVVGYGVRAVFDFSEQVIELDAPKKERTQYRGGFAGDFGGGYGDAAGATDKHIEEDPLPMLSGKLSNGQFISAALLGHKAKQFDDGLYAQVELLASKGTDRLIGKTAFLKEILQSILEANPRDISVGSALIAGAVLLKEGGFNLPESLKVASDKVLGKFLANEVASKPIGFYTWTDELKSIFRSDRFLQGKFSDFEFEAVINALRMRADLKESYFKHLLLPSRLTNPLRSPGLEPALSSPEWRAHGEPLSFFPGSTSFEFELMDILRTLQIVPTAPTVIDEIILQLESGTISFAPTPASGWYDHQLWALSALVTTNILEEADHANFTVNYKAHLKELFKGFYALTRETHIKQLEMSWGSAGLLASLTLCPALSVEPLPTFYYRRSLSYRFVRQMLVEFFGEAVLGSVGRISADGESSRSLLEELMWMEKLFAGACTASCKDLGMDARRFFGEESIGSTNAFLEFRAHVTDDPDLMVDARMMVPLHLNPDGSTAVWVVMGWSELELSAKYVRPPKVVSADFDHENPRVKAMAQVNHPTLLSAPPVNFGVAKYAAYEPVSAEITVKRILNREEFRALCNEQKSSRKIIEKLT
jgi:hypothetical protein